MAMAEQGAAQHAMQEVNARHQAIHQEGPIYLLEGVRGDWTCTIRIGQEETTYSATSKNEAKKGCAMLFCRQHPLQEPEAEPDHLHQPDQFQPRNDYSGAIHACLSEQLRVDEDLNRRLVAEAGQKSAVRQGEFIRVEWGEWEQQRGYPRATITLLAPLLSDLAKPGVACSAVFNRLRPHGERGSQLKAQGIIQSVSDDQQVLDVVFLEDFDPLMHGREDMLQFSPVHIEAPWQRMQASLERFVGLQECRTPGRILSALDACAGSFGWHGILPQWEDEPGLGAARVREARRFAQYMALDDSQVAAVCAAFQRSVTFVHGPPGTGKSFTAVALVLAILDLFPRMKVLLVAQSNKAVDNLVDKLARLRPQLTERPYRMTRHTSHRLDKVTERPVPCSARAWLAEDAGRRLAELEAAELQHLLTPAAFQELVALRRYLALTRARELLTMEELQELRDLERDLSEIYVVRARVAATTVSMCETEAIRRTTYDWVIADEGGQLSLAAFMPAAMRGAGRITIFGDPMQLGPPVFPAECPALGISVFDAFRDHAQVGRCMLTQHYRGPQALIDLPSQLWYDGRLRSRVRRDLGRPGNGLLWKALLFLEGSTEELAGHSWQNPAEAAAVVEDVRQMVARGFRMEDVVVITMYSAQQRLLRHLLSEAMLAVAVHTVHSFHGSEALVVVLSLVRSGEGGVGFSRDARRMCVALTRSRGVLRIFTTRATIQGGDIGRRIFRHYARENLLVDV